MSSHNKARKMVYMGLLISLAMTLSYFERFIPLPYSVPGMKLGLANIITVTCIMYFKKREVFMIVISRILLTALIIGSMMSFFYSLSGGVLSSLGMLFVYRYFGNKVSTIGISVFGGVLHNVGQLLVLNVITGRTTIALYYAPILMIAGILTGVFVGVASMYFIKHVKVIFRFDS
jgi:heptaprenyl diphosphate synthase